MHQRTLSRKWKDNRQNGKVFVNYISDNSLTSRIYKEPFNSITKNPTIQLKNGQNLYRVSPKNDKQMVKKHIENMLNIITIREIQFNTTSHTL